MYPDLMYADLDPESEYVGKLLAHTLRHLQVDLLFGILATRAELLTRSARPETIDTAKLYRIRMEFNDEYRPDETAVIIDDQDSFMGVGISRARSYFYDNTDDFIFLVEALALTDILKGQRLEYLRSVIGSYVDRLTEFAWEQTESEQVQYDLEQEALFGLYRLLRDIMDEKLTVERLISTDPAVGSDSGSVSLWSALAFLQSATPSAVRQGDVLREPPVSADLSTQLLNMLFLDIEAAIENLQPVLDIAVKHMLTAYYEELAALQKFLPIVMARKQYYDHGRQEG